MGISQEPLHGPFGEFPNLIASNLVLVTAVLFCTCALFCAEGALLCPFASASSKPTRIGQRKTYRGVGLFLARFSRGASPGNFWKKGVFWNIFFCKNWLGRVQGKIWAKKGLPLREKKTDKEKSHKGIGSQDAPEASQGQTRDVPDIWA